MASQEQNQDDINEGEEWLSDGLLTDDDAMNQDAENTSQEAMGACCLSHHYEPVRYSDDDDSSTENEKHNIQLAKIMGQQQNIINSVKEILNDIPRPGADEASILQWERATASNYIIHGPTQSVGQVLVRTKRDFRNRRRRREARNNHVYMSSNRASSDQQPSTSGYNANNSDQQAGTSRQITNIGYQQAGTSRQSTNIDYQQAGTSRQSTSIGYQQASTSGQNTNNSDQQASTSGQKTNEIDEQTGTSGQTTNKIDQQAGTSGQNSNKNDQQTSSGIQSRRFTDDDFDDLPDDLSTFLIRKSDGAILETRKDISDNDGNDTDELLRMLGDEDKDRVPEKPAGKAPKPAADDSTDDDIFDTLKNDGVKVSKNIITKKVQIKNQRDSDTDQSTESESDERARKKFKPNRKSNGSAKDAPKPAKSNPSERNIPKAANEPKAKAEDETLQANSTLRKLRPLAERSSRLSINSEANVQSHAPKPKPKTVRQLRESTKEVTKTVKEVRKTIKEVPKTIKEVQKTIKEVPKIIKDVSKSIKQVPKTIKEEPKTYKQVQKTVKQVPKTIKEVIKTDNISEKMEEEFLDEEEFGYDNFMSEQTSDSIMKFGADESKATADDDSDFEDSNKSEMSFCDEVMSSAESDVDDWFTLDIRTERAGDYIPLLGSKALEILTREKERVLSQMDNLKDSLSVLSTGGKQLSLKINNCTKTLSDLEAQLALV